MEINVYIVGLFCALICYLVYKFRKLANYFNDRNIPYVSPVWPLGSDVKCTLFRHHYCHSFNEIYKQLKGHKVGGFYMLLKPIVMVRDAEYVAKVLITDFTHFSDRGFFVDEKVNPLDANLFFLNGEKWKYLRNKLTPAFTPEKLKWMFESLTFCSDKFVNDYLDTAVPFDQDLDMRDTFSRYTTDVISICALGIKSNTLEDPNSKYREIGKMFFNLDQWPAAYLLARFLLHKFMSFFKIRTLSEKITIFFSDVVQQTFQHRLKTGHVGHDFVQTLLDLRKKAQDEKKLIGKDDSIDGSVGDGGLKTVEFEIDDDLLTAQLYLFFLAGFETSATTLNTLLYFLSRNPECQEKAREEAQEVLKSAGGSFTFNSLVNLKYLQNCIYETLRLVPPLPAHFRTCTKDYTFPDGSKIEDGATVVIPFHSLHRDPQYFSDPDEFIPERFDEPIAAGTYTPFGEGQRICIGKRFSLIEVKLTIAKILLKYKLKPSDKQADLFDFNPLSFIVLHKQPLLYRIERI